MEHGEDAPGHGRAQLGHGLAPLPGDQLSGDQRPGEQQLAELAEVEPVRLHALGERYLRQDDSGQCGEAEAAGTAARDVSLIGETLARVRSPECVRLALDLAERAVSVPRPGGDAWEAVPEAVAAQLALSQTPRALEPLFTDVPSTLDAALSMALDAAADPGVDPAVDMRARILGEMACVGVGQGRSVLDAYAERLRALGHPLAWLPRARLDIEYRFGQRARGLGHLKTAAQLRSRFPELLPTEAGEEAGRTASECPDAVRTDLTGQPFTVGEWGRAPEARFFSLPEPLAQVLPEPGRGAASGEANGRDGWNIAFLQALPLDCLAGADLRPDMAVTCHTTADDVLDELFKAVAIGGAQGRPRSRAQARLHAWQSMFALMGLPHDTPFMDAVRRAADYRWLRFLAVGDWFRNSVNQVGFAVLDPNRTKVAVLAAADRFPDETAA